jgi:hypothetical protein
MAAFLIMGHGQENVDVNFDARPVIPPGYTLVTLAVCGVSTTQLNVLPILDAFHNPANRDILSDPAAYKGALEGIIGNEINIYKEGDKYPKLNLHLLTYFPPQRDVGVVDADIARSGVFRFPMTYEDTKGKHRAAINSFLPGITAKDQYSHWEKHGDLANKYIVPLPLELGFRKDKMLIPEIVTDMYKDSILPTQEEVRPLLEKNSLGFIEKRTVHPLEAAFERGGPGVYYYVICRNPVTKFSTMAYRNLLESWEIPTPEYNALTLNERMNNAKVIETLMPRMTELSRNALANPNKYSWAKKNFQNAPSQFQAVLNRTRSIRRHSATQQKKGGATKRRKRKHSH